MLSSRRMHRDIPLWRNSHWYVTPTSFHPTMPHILIGMKRFPAGRMNESPSIGLSSSLHRAGFPLGRLQTGTPARLLRDSIDFGNGRMEKQEGDLNPNPFSYLHGEEDLASGPRSKDGMEQVACHRTQTTPETHRIIRDNLHLSVHIQETKKGTQSFNPSLVTDREPPGPRYCPSLEAKITRFPEKDSHIVWLEPEGFDSGMPPPSPTILHLLIPSHAHRPYIPKRSLQLPPRRTPRTLDTHNSRVGECKDGETGLWG